MQPTLTDLKEKMEQPKNGEAMESYLKGQKAYNEVQAWIKQLYARQRAKPKPQDYDYVMKRLNKLEKRDRILQQIIHLLWSTNDQSNTIIGEYKKPHLNKEKVDRALRQRDEYSDSIIDLEKALEKLEEEFA